MKLKDLMEKYGEYDVVLSKREATNEIMIEGRKPKAKTVWDLEEGDRYFVLYPDEFVAEYKWTKDTRIGKTFREQGSAFITQEEAEKEIERRKVEALLIKHGGRRWFKKYGDNYYFWVTHAGSELRTAKTCGNLQGIIYFDSEGEIIKATEEIGGERIIKALFDVRDKEE